MRNLLIRHWWIGFVIAILFFLASYILGSHGNSLNSQFASVLTKYFSYLIVFLTLVIYFKTRQRRKLLASQTGLESIRSLSWRKFEDLITEAYRQNGYKIKREPVDGSDGGIDIIVEKESLVTLVQCKQWRQRKLGVKIVREMFGILSGSEAAEVHIVTTGRVTKEAQNFAKDKPIKIIYGQELLNLISDAQKESTPNKTKIESKTVCPECGSEMVIRKARKGNNAGKEFWGCIQFPKCRATLSVSG